MQGIITQNLCIVKLYIKSGGVQGNLQSGALFKIIYESKEKQIK